MITASKVKVVAKCDACQHKWTMTEAQKYAAADYLGGPMSPCCFSVATIVSIKGTSFHQRRRRG